MTNSLQPLKPGKVWGVRIYPGGRREMRQYYPHELMTVQQAMEALALGRHARVAIDDLTFIPSRRAR